MTLISQTPNTINNNNKKGQIQEQMLDHTFQSPFLSPRPIQKSSTVKYNDRFRTPIPNALETEFLIKNVFEGSENMSPRSLIRNTPIVTSSESFDYNNLLKSPPVSLIKTLRDKGFNIKEEKQIYKKKTKIPKTVKKVAPLKELFSRTRQRKYRETPKVSNVMKSPIFHSNSIKYIS